MKPIDIYVYNYYIDSLKKKKRKHKWLSSMKEPIDEDLGSKKTPIKNKDLEIDLK